MSVGTITYPAANVAWPKDTWGGYALTVFDYAGPDSYVTGGDPIDPGQIKLGTIEVAGPATGVNGAGTAAVVFQYNKGTGKLQAFWQTGAAAAAALPEVDNGTDLSDYTATLLFLGRG